MLMFSLAQSWIPIEAGSKNSFARSSNTRSDPRFMRSCVRSKFNGRRFVTLLRYVALGILVPENCFKGFGGPEGFR